LAITSSNILNIKTPELRAAVEAWREANPRKECRKEDREALLKVCDKEVGDHTAKQRGGKAEVRCRS
jgi:hypothetical protein